jgi:UDP-3-O-[3-hydroxymyristoyl] N-acetylglucosamine deacetylase
VVAERAGHAMHTALVSRLMKDRSAWELAHVPMEPAPDEENAPPEGNVNVNIPVLVSA